MNSLNIGDVVVLKSGGPSMTVERVGEDVHGRSCAWCIWFEETQKVTGTFPPATLEVVE